MGGNYGHHGANLSLLDLSEEKVRRRGEDKQIDRAAGTEERFSDVEFGLPLLIKLLPAIGNLAGVELALDMYLQKRIQS